MKKYFVFVVLLILIFPLINADIIMPGEKRINIENKIDNLNEFPDYVFISVGTEGAGLWMCPIKIIESEGIIQEYHKYCYISIYAISKGNFNQTLIGRINNESKDYDEILELFDSIPKQKVIENVRSYKTIPKISIVKDISNFYEIDLSKVKIKPDKIKKQINYGEVLIYLLISLIALILIIEIKKRENKK